MDTAFVNGDPMGASGSFVTIMVVLAAGVVLVMVPYWRIFTKAGYSGWWSLTLLIPGINIFMMYYLAFAEWPIHSGTNPALEPPPAHSHRSTVPPGTIQR